MPSQLYKNEGISFVCAKSFKWRDTEYHQGDDFPQEEANNVETMVRSRFLIPVVDDLNDKPRHWHREVRPRDEVLARLNQEVVQLVMPGEEPPTDAPAPSEELPAQTQADDTSGEGGAYDPGEHTVAEVTDYMEQHPDEADAVRASEAAGKNRKGIVEGYG
jgi:hypothetical protein